MEDYFSPYKTKDKILYLLVECWISFDWKNEYTYLAFLVY